MQRALRDVIEQLRLARHLFTIRDPERKRLSDERAREAVRRSRTEPLRQIEDDLGIDTYAMPARHNGYAFHKRNQRAKSRSEEQRRFAEVEQRFKTEVDPLLERDTVSSR